MCFGVRLANLGEARGEQSILHEYLTSLPAEFDQEVRHLRMEEILTTEKVVRIVKRRFEILESETARSRDSRSANIACARRSNALGSKQKKKRGKDLIETMAKVSNPGARKQRKVPDAMRAGLKVIEVRSALPSGVTTATQGGTSRTPVGRQNLVSRYHSQPLRVVMNRACVLS